MSRHRRPGDAIVRRFRVEVNSDGFILLPNRRLAGDSTEAAAFPLGGRERILSWGRHGSRRSGASGSGVPKLELLKLRYFE